MYNPTRRSRKIGLTQGGRVIDGAASEKESRAFPQSIWRQLSDAPAGDYQILRENPSRDFYHPCTPEQVRAVLSHLPRRYTRSLRAVVFRRLPKRDHERSVEARRRMSCIVLNAFPASNEIDWGTASPAESTRRHYAPWCDRWELRDGRWIQAWTPEEVQRYYLYHLLLHELGHINQPDYHSLRRRESFAEDFALTWARKLKRL